MSDFYSDSAQKRLAMIEAERASALADLAAHRANSDYESAGNAIQQVANLDSERANLVQLYNSYVQSQTPVSPPELSAEEKAAKPVNRMDYRDVYEMAKGSKHGVDDDAFRQGMAEVRRRRASDYYGGR